MTDVLFAEIFDGDLPPKKDAYKTCAVKEVPDIDTMLKGTRTGASDALIKNLETGEWISRLADGAQPVQKSPLLNDEFFSKLFLDSKFVMDLLKSPLQNADQGKADKLAKMAQHDRKVTHIVERFKNQLSSLVTMPDGYWQSLIDAGTEYVANAIQNA